MEANVNEVASSFLLLQLHRIRTLSIFELEFANPPNSRKLLQKHSGLLEPIVKRLLQIFTGLRQPVSHH